MKVDLKKLIEGDWKKYDKNSNCEFNKVYYFEYNGDLEKLSFNDGEVQEVRWMGVEDIKESMLNKSQKWAPPLKGFIEISDYLITGISIRDGSALGGKKQD